MGVEWQRCVGVDVDVDVGDFIPLYVCPVDTKRLEGTWV